MAKQQRTTAKRLLTQQLQKAEVALVEGEDIDKEAIIRARQEFDDKHEAYCATGDEAEKDSDTYYQDVIQRYIRVMKEVNVYLLPQPVKAEEEHGHVMNDTFTSNTTDTDMKAMLLLLRGCDDVFDGNLLHYYSFIRNFEAFVAGVDDQGLLYSLFLKALSPAIQEYVRPCSMSKQPYDDARKLIDTDFGDATRVKAEILRAIRSGPAVKAQTEYEALYKQLNMAVISFDSMGGVEVDQDVIAKIVARLPKVYVDKWRRLAVRKRSEHLVYPNLQDLCSFVGEIRDELRDPVYGQGLVTAGSRPSATSTSHNVEARDDTPMRAATCMLCTEMHRLHQCPRFNEMTPQQRKDFVISKRLCFNCLNAHQVKFCRLRLRCRVCSRKHSSLLHDTYVNVNANVNDIHAHATNNDHVALLPTVHVRVNDRVFVHCLLDTGSNASFISRSLVKRLGLKPEQASVNLNTLSGGTSSDSGCVSLTLAGDNGARLRMSRVYVIDKIHVPVASDVSLVQYPHLHQIPYVPTDQVDILIGQDHGWALRDLDYLAGADDEPVAARTLLGWTVSGPVARPGAENSNVVVTSNYVVSMDDKSVLSLWDDSVELVDGQYQLPIPWNNGKTLTSFPNNRFMAECRHKSLLRRFDSDEEFKSKYEQSMDCMISAGYAEEVPQEEVGRDDGCVWYLPHHGVVSPKKEKIRVVFDCKAQCGGVSLNNQAFQGPDLIQRLFGILVRFRLHEYVILGDIEAMYHQVRVPLIQRDALRFLWRGAVYRMTSHLFGGVWCAASSTFALRQTVYDNPEYDNAVKQAVLESFYVDDMLMSMKSKEEAWDMMMSLRDLLSKGGFNLQKLGINDDELLECIPVELRAKEMKDLGEKCVTSLGMRWNVHSDVLYFVTPELSVMTRRSFVSTISQIFDPLGLISPLLLPGRVLLQKIVRLGYDWDQVLSVELAQEAREWLRSLDKLQELEVPRQIITSGCVKSQLHVFCDASMDGYGCVVYVRNVGNGAPSVNLVASKSKVVPMKPSHTIPRLELMSCVSGVKLATELAESMGLELEETRFYTDSLIALGWMSNDSKRRDVFVHNRVGFIREKSEPHQWCHVASSDNAADVVSRGVLLDAMDWDEWLYGPSFLRDGDFVCGETVAMATTVESEDIFEGLCERISCYERLIRVVARCIMVCRRQKDLDVDLLDCAEQVVMKVSQKSFNEGDFKNLSPVLCDDGLYRVGGRIPAGHDLPCRQIFVCGRVAELLVISVHEKCGHMGIDFVLARLRERFWVSRAFVKRLLRRCVQCQKQGKRLMTQKMANLPPERLYVDRPCFYATGLDCFGPILVKRGRSEVKRYGVIFTCLTSRAVHIEKLDSMDTDSILMAIDRFIARKSRPSVFVSDNGRNFTSADKVLKSEIDKWNQQIIEESLLQRRVEWKFNPPYASHYGGVWERHIRTIRKLMFHLLTSTNITDEVLSTVFAEIETIINDRPISQVLEDGACVILRPRDLLSAACIPDRVHVLESRHVSTAWKKAKSLADAFWRRWVKFYIQQQQTRSKWHDEKENLKVDDIVLVSDVQLTRRDWPLGRVTKITYGRDGLVRTVDLICGGKVIRRPVSKLVHLQI